MEFWGKSSHSDYWHTWWWCSWWWWWRGWFERCQFEYTSAWFDPRFPSQYILKPRCTMGMADAIISLIFSAQREWLIKAKMENPFQVNPFWSRGYLWNVVRKAFCCCSHCAYGPPWSPSHSCVGMHSRSFCHFSAHRKKHALENNTFASFLPI